MLASRSEGQEFAATVSTLDSLSLRLNAIALRLAYHLGRWPAAVQVVLVYLASRIVSWFIFSTVGLQQTFSPWKQGAMSYGEFVMIWDADWYQKISQQGYPQALPLDANGLVAQNEWAFYPLYPLLARTLVTVTGLPYETVAPTLSLLAGFGAAWLLYRLFRLCCQQASDSLGTDRGEERWHTTALWAVAAVSFCAVAPVLQTGYAESLGLLFLIWTLLYLVQGSYTLMLVPALLAALTRPVGVPLGATVGIWWLVCWLRDYSARRPQRGAALAALNTTGWQLISAVMVCAFAFIHPAHAWLVTGRIDAYTATETAWRAGGEHVLLFMPWVHQSQHYLGVAGPLVLTLLLLLFFAALLSRTVRLSLPLPLLLWVWSYTLYMLMFFNPQSSTFRLLLPLFALYLPLVMLSSSRAYRGLLVLSGIAMQFGWVGWLWHWKQLPGGGDYPP